MTDRIALLLGDDAEVAAACARRLGADGFGVAAALGTGSPRDAIAGVDHLLDPFARTAEGGAGRVVDAEAIGPVDVLVTLPGQPAASPILRGALSSMDDEHQRLVSWQFGAAREAARLMVPRRRGRLIFVSSVGALSGTSFEAPYGAASATVIGLGRALARELGPRSITANVVLTGPR